MIPNTINETIELGDGRQIVIETGKLAKQADGSVVVRLGKTMLLATVVSDKSFGQTDFFPLTVDYREKFSSAGRFPGGFFKREARPTDTEILTMRLVDRVLRPMFPKDYYSETQVMIQLMSHDDNVMPDALAGLAASACIYISDIPFEDPISEVRLGRVNGEYIINPNKKQIEESDIDLMVGASESSVVMVEGEMDEISESEMLDAIRAAHDAIKIQCRAQRNLVEKLGGKTIRAYEKPDQNQDVSDKIHEFAYDKCFEIASKNTSKQDRTEQVKTLKSECLSLFDEEFIVENEPLINAYFDEVNKTAVRNLILDKQIRLDGRKPEEVRPIWCEADYLPSTHGSAVFTRGETQALATVTLGTSREVNVIDSPTDQSEEKFYLHYNFPPFSTGEARPLRGTSRREIGHGNLAQRSLKKMIPQDWAYTVRVVSEILESNGSSSMASVCAGTMALMDAGVPIKRPVSGIAMGLIVSDDSYTILSDILGDEDHLGDMDFKIAGTQEGITACQMDIKVKGLSYDILAKAVNQAKDGRSQILEKMLITIPKPNQEIKAHAPKIIKMTIPKDFIGAFIGPSGKNIQAVQKETSTTIAVIEEDDFGVVEIFGVDQQGIDQAIQAVKNCIFKPEVGTVYDVKVIKVLDFGAVVEFVPGKEVLLHISEIDHKRIEKVTDVLNLGDIIQVKYLGIDQRTKKPKVSRKATINKT